MLRINTNVAAFNTLRQARHADEGVTKALERLSSGLRVNRASDDAAGLSISEALRTQVRGSQRAAANIQDGISLVNVADGALNEVHAALQRMRELAVQAANGSLSASDRAATDAEFVALRAEIGNIAANTSFNGMDLFIGQAGSIVTGASVAQSGVIATNVGTTTFTLAGPGAFSPSNLGAVTLTAEDSLGVTQALTVGPATQTLVGYNGTTALYQYAVSIDNTQLAGTGPWTITGSAVMDYPMTNDPLEIEVQTGANFGQTETISIPPVNPGVMGIGATSLSGQPAAQQAISDLDTAIAYISSARSAMGATARSLEHAATSMAIATENQSAAFSRIRDSDMAQHMTELTRRQILTQSSISMLSVANDSSTIMRLFS